MEQFRSFANHAGTSTADEPDCKIAIKSVNSAIQTNGIVLMRKALLVAAAALLVSTPPAVAAWYSGPDGAASKERMVCKSRTKSGNTRFTNRVCRTAAEWEQISEMSKRNASEMVDRPQIEIRRE